MKKIAILLTCALFITACSSSGGNVNKNIDKIAENKQVIVDELNTISQTENQIQEAFESDLENPENNNLDNFISSQNEIYSKFNKDLESFKNDLVKIDTAGIEGTEAEILSRINSNQRELIVDFEQASSIFDSKIEALNALNDSIKKEAPTQLDTNNAIIELNKLQEEQSSLFEKINISSEEFEDLRMKYDAYLNGSTVIFDEEESDEETNEGAELENSEPQYTVNAGNSMIETIEQTDEQPVLLTFDDAPDEEGSSYSLEIAKTLQEKGHKAIFFVNGMYLKNDFGKDQIKQIYDLGFEIGNHTTNHPYLSTLDYEQTKEEIVETNDLIEEITGKRPRFFRPPFGDMGEFGQQVADEENMVSMNWTYGYDWEPEYQEASALTDITLNTEFLYSGANILMHDRPWTAEAISDIADGLVEKGYTIIDPRLIEGKVE